MSTANVPDAEYLEFLASMYSDGTDPNGHNARLKRISAALASPPAGDAVAWHVNHRGSCQIYTSLDGLDLEGCIVTPVYAAPAAPAQPVADLTDSQIAECWPTKFMMPADAKLYKFARNVVAKVAAPAQPDHDQAADLFCAHVTDILDGKDDGTGGNLEPWGAVRRRLLALVTAPVAEPAWQPIETAPKDIDVFFWVIPKTAEESYVDTSGNPIISPHDNCYRVTGKFGCWSSLYKATHWMPHPAPPASHLPTPGMAPEPKPEV